MADRDFKAALYGEFSRIGAALASERRLEMLDVLAQAPRYVDAIAAETGLSVANASQHLQVLKDARLVASERHGTRVRYRLADEAVLRLWLALRDVGASRLQEVAALARSRNLGEFGGDATTLDELRRLHAAGEVVVLDVRPREEFEYAHLDGALSMPVDEIAERLDELPRDRPIVAYCRGVYCTFAEEAVSLLRAHGFQVSRTEDGWAEWLGGQRLTRPRATPRRRGAAASAP